MNSISIGYDQDFYVWLTHNATLLRQGKFLEIDVENIAEELEGMSRREKRALINRLAVLLTHLLKWQFQPGKRSNSWRYTIEEQRRAVLKLLKESPSLHYQLYDKLSEAYQDGIIKAAKETHLDKTAFPSVCPYTLDQTLDENFYPE